MVHIIGILNSLLFWIEQEGAGIRKISGIWAGVNIIYVFKKAEDAIQKGSEVGPGPTGARQTQGAKRSSAE